MQIHSSKFNSYQTHTHISWMTSLNSQPILLHILTKFYLSGILYVLNKWSDSLAKVFLSIKDMFGFNSLSTTLPIMVETCWLLSWPCWYFRLGCLTLYLRFIWPLSAHFPGGGIFPPRKPPGYLQLRSFQPCNYCSHSSYLCHLLLSLTIGAPEIGSRMTSTLPYLQPLTLLLLSLLKSKLQKYQSHGLMKTLTPLN